MFFYEDLQWDNNEVNDYGDWKSYSLPSATCRTEKAGGEFSLSSRPENHGGGWALVYIPESKGPGTRNTDSRFKGRKKWMPQIKKRERKFTILLPFCSVQTLQELDDEDLLYSVC